MDDSLIRDYTQLRTELVGPVFTKIWDTPGSGYSERMKHVIEPAFTLDYTTPINNYKRTPLLTDTSDFVVGGTSRFTYGLTNRLMYRGKTVDGVRGQTREFVTVGLQQTYYSNPESSKYDTSYSSSNTNRSRSTFRRSSLPPACRRRPDRCEHARRYDVSGLGLAVLGVGSTVSAGLSSGSLQFSRQHLTRTSQPNTLSLRFDLPPLAERPLHRHLRAELGHHAFDHRHAERDGDVHGAVLRPADGISEVQPGVLSADSVGPPVQLPFVLAGLGTFSNFFGAFGNSLR